MKIRMIAVADGTYKVEQPKPNKYGNPTPITKIEGGIHEHKGLPPIFGYSIYTTDNKPFAWVPYHAVTAVYFEVENES